MATGSDIEVRRAAEGDASQIADIYNQGIDERSATFVTTHVTCQEMLHTIKSQSKKYPILVATSKKSENILGWASISLYSPRPCYDGIGEVSVYIDKKHRRRGIGQALAEAIYSEAEKLGYWKLMVRIFAFNNASTALFKKEGYVEAGFHPKHGKLDGKWIDVLELERLIPKNIT